MPDTNAKGGEDFARQWATTIAGERSQYLYCKFCNIHITGGVTRLKHHLAGTHKGTRKCSNAPPDVAKMCADALKNLEKEKLAKETLAHSIGRMGDEYSEDVLGSSESGVTSHVPRTVGPMDKFASTQVRQTTMENRYKKEHRELVVAKIGRCLYANGLPFNLVNSPYWKEMVDEIGKYGMGLKQPSMYEVRTRVLKAEVQGIDAIKATHMKTWEQYGCTLMSDGWSDQKSRSLINFLVNSPEGTFFYKSIDASEMIKTGEYLFQRLDEMVEEIGEKNVLQVITDSHPSYVNAGQRLMEKRTSLYWAPCAAHCIDLMLEDIGKLKIHQECLELAKGIISFIYNHCWVLSLMRKYSGGKELLRPAVTRFSTAYLTLQSLYTQKQALRAMFSSDEFGKSSWAKKPNGAKAKNTVLYDRAFWGRVLFCVITTLPLVRVLREVDSETRPSMPYLYESLDDAKERIAEACGGIQRKYKPFWNLIDRRWSEMLHRPIHAAAYYLNPKNFYGERFSTHPEVRKGLYECMARMIPDINERAQADVDLDAYKNKLGDFGSDLAQKTIKSRTPAAWWERFGEGTPTLQRFAVRILSLTTSASGCERNWSTFEQVHSKRRNRLEQERLNSLVYVMYNIKLRERNMRRKAKKLDPILIEDAPSDDEWIVDDESLADNPRGVDSGDGERDFLDITAIHNQPTLEVDDDSLPSKRQRIESIDNPSSASKGKDMVVEDATGDIEDFIEQEDADIILEEEDLFRQ